MKKNSELKKICIKFDIIGLERHYKNFFNKL